MSDKLIGTKPNQVPTNADLGEMAYQNKDDVTIAAASSSSLTIKRKDDDGDLVKLKRDETAAGQLGVYASGVGAYLNGTSLLSLRIAGGDMLTLTNSNLYPTSDSGVNLGLSNRHFNNLHMSGTAYIDGGIQSASYSHLDDLPDIRPSLLLDFANSKTLDPRIQFARGSTATYWDGKTTTKADENLITYSDSCSGGSWEVYGTASITANNATAPDGTTTATLYTTSSGGGKGSVYYSPVVSGNHTRTVYVKKGTADYFFMDYPTTNAGVWWNLSTGAVATDNSGTAFITSVGNGWYRLGIRNKTKAGSAIAFGFSNANNTDNSTSGQTGYFWGAQVEARSTETAYTPTTSTIVVKYQPTLQTAASGEARFDHDPVTGESKGLLMEGARANLANWSEVALNFFGGNLSGVEMSANAGIAPDGTHTADLVHQSTLSEHQSIYAGIGGISGGTPYTRSCFFKSRGARYVALMQYDGFTNHGTTYDLQDGVVVVTEGSATGTIEDVGNGWFRCTQTYTTTAAATSERIQIALPSGGNNTFAHTGDGWSGVLFWGWQLEAAPFASSYIKTTGSTATRSTDVASMTGSNFTSWYSDAEYSVYGEFERNWENSSVAAFYPMIMGITDGGTDNCLSVYLNQGYSFTFEPRADGSTWAVLSTDASAGTSHKFAGAIKTNDMAVSFDDEAVQTDTFGLVPRDQDQLWIGSRNNVFQWYGTFKKLAFYPKRLSDATLQAMTEE